MKMTMVQEMANAVAPWNSTDSVMASDLRLRGSISIRISGIEAESRERQREIDVCLRCPYPDCKNCLKRNKQAVIAKLEAAYS